MAKKKKPKKKLSKRERAARLRAQAARLEAAALEAEADAEEGDEDEGEEDWEEGETQITNVNPSALLPQMGGGIEGVLGMLGGIGGLMSNMGVEQETPKDKNGNSFTFQRHAGRVRNVKLGADGKPKEIDFEPEEWPPRGEKF